METVQLASTSAARQLEAELAGKSQALAQFERDFKTEKATWAVDADTQQGEVRCAAGRCSRRWLLVPKKLQSNPERWGRGLSRHGRMNGHAAQRIYACQLVGLPLGPHGMPACPPVPALLRAAGSAPAWHDVYGVTHCSYMLLHSLLMPMHARARTW